MKQLKMRRESAPIAPRPLPCGYTFATFGGSEEEIDDWLRACVGIVGEDAKREVFESSIRSNKGVDPAADVWFILDPTGKRVATITPCRREDGSGLVHMVGALPESRGIGLGHALIEKACALLEERGHERAYLTTDEHRLPAVKTYLDAGFRPVIYPDPESDMNERWDAVLKTLAYRSVERFVEEE